MNLIEALKANEWIFRKSKPERIIGGMIDHEMMDLTREDILAEDWEIEPRTVGITREQFNAAWDNALIGIGTRLDRDAMAKELGL
jgi:hypothetical protein